MKPIEEIVKEYMIPVGGPADGSKGVMIVSGGMDSVTLLHFLVKYCKCDIDVLSFDYGQKHSVELVCAEKNCEILGLTHHIIKLPFMGELFKSNLLKKGEEIPEGHYEAENMKQTVVPNRNMIMSSIAVGYGQSIGAEFLALGVHAGDHAIYPDCREEYIEALKGAVELSDWCPFTIYAPFQRMTKKEILEVGLQLDVNYGETHTCYKGKTTACGKCGSCQERLEAFAELKVEDPLEYE